MHPSPLVLLALSIILVLGGFTAAAVVAVLYRKTQSLMIDRLQIHGLIVFCGFAAAMLGNPDLAIQSLTKPD